MYVWHIRSSRPSLLLSNIMKHRIMVEEERVLALSQLTWDAHLLAWTGRHR